MVFPPRQVIPAATLFFNIGLGITVFDSSTAADSVEPALKVEIGLHEAKVVVGRIAAVDVRITNRSGHPLHIYNPRFNLMLARQSAVMALLDSDGKYITNLLDKNRGSFRTPESSDWVHIPPGGSTLSV